jgi:glycosyltransferase involved in cell wall biosynthesis
MQQYKILHVAQWLRIGGAEKVILDLVSDLDRRKFEPVVCAFQRGIMENDFNDVGIKFEVIERKHLINFVFLLKIIGLMKRWKIELVHCHGVPPTIYGGLAAKLLGIPLIITVHGKSAFSVKVGIKGLQYAQRFGAKIVTVSKELKSELVRDVGLKEAAISTIYNGINVNGYPRCSTQIEEVKRKELSLNSDTVIGSVGSLREAKGHRYLIQSLPKVLHKYPDLKLIIIGDGELKDELNILAKKVNVEKHVLFLGQRRDVRELISVFDLLVQPSLTEGISIVILEAMAASKPVIATDVGGNSTLVEKHRTGLLVAPGDTESLANAIVCLLDNKEERVIMGKAGFERAKQNYSLQKSVSEYEKIYLSLLE